MVEKEKNIQRWFDKLRLNSWEVEILIVGFVLVILFQVPTTIKFEITKLLNSSSFKETSSFLYIGGQLLSLVSISISVNIIIFCLSVYLGFRGFWVGILGLSSVYPKGINVKNLNFSEKFTNQIEKYNFNNFIIKIDNICSSIFSFSFLLSFSIISFLIFCFELGMLGLFGATISEKYPNTALENITSILFFIFLLPGFIYFIDYFLFSIIKKIKWKPFAFCYYYIDRFYKYATLIFVYDHLYYTFISNVKRRIVFLILFSYTIITSFLDPINERYFFPKANSKNLMQYHYYENQFLNIDKEDEESYPQNSFINSEVISSNYLKLYIPYIPIINNGLEDLCPDIMYIYYDDSEHDKEDEVLNCINEAYNIFIDDMQIDSDFIFYFYSHRYINIQTFFMVVPLDKIENGKHILKINKNVKSSAKIENQTVTITHDDKESDLIRLIPFYLQRD